MFLNGSRLSTEKECSSSGNVPKSDVMMVLRCFFFLKFSKLESFPRRQKFDSVLVLEEKAIMDFPTEGKEDPDEPSVSRAGDIELIERDRSSNFDNRMSPDHQQNLYYQALWKEIPETEHVGRSIQTTTLVIIATSCIGVVLIYLKSVLLPFLMATLIYYLLIPVVNYLTHEEDHCNCCFTGRRARVEKWTRLNVAPAIGADPDSPSRTYLAARSLIFCLTTGKFPRWLAVLVAILLALSVILFVVWIILSGLHSISKDLDMYVQSFRNLISGLVRIVQGYGVEIREEDVYEQINKIPIEQIAISLANAVLSLLKSVAFMIIFVIYLLMERSSSNRGVSAGKQVSDLNMRALGMKKDINMQVRKYISVKVGTTTLQFNTLLLTFHFDF